MIKISLYCVFFFTLKLQNFLTHLFISLSQHMNSLSKIHNKQYFTIKKHFKTLQILTYLGFCYPDYELT